jgi:hypothetical protein
VPISGATNIDVEKLYAEYYTTEDILTYGVVAVDVKVVNNY